METTTTAHQWQYENEDIGKAETYDLLTYLLLTERSSMLLIRG
jgi:hypothetical protein